MKAFALLMHNTIFGIFISEDLAQTRKQELVDSGKYTDAELYVREYNIIENLEGE